MSQHDLSRNEVPHLPEATQDQSGAQELHGQRALLARLYREIGLAAVAAELDLHQCGPRSYANPAALSDMRALREEIAASRHEDRRGQRPAAMIRAA